MKILRVKKTNIYDVFMGDGWKQWTRIRNDKEGVHFLKGDRLHSSQISTVSIALALRG
jgi:hypothetical protein